MKTNIELWDIILEINIRNVQVETLANLNLQDITEIWNRCWLGYYYNMSYSKEHMKVWLELSQVSLEYSTAIYYDGRVVGFTLLAIDKNEGWIAGACIDPAYRNNGLFKILLRSQLNLAKSIFLKKIYLEVLEQNYARQAYQAVGFVNTRQLNVYRTLNIKECKNEILRIPPVFSTTLEEYFSNRSHSFFSPAWQRRERYLRRYSTYKAFLNDSETAGALLSGDKSGLLLDVWSSNLAGAKEILSAILHRTDSVLSLINQPNDWISTALRLYGIKPTANQYEMCVELS